MAAPVEFANNTGQDNVMDRPKAKDILAEWRAKRRRDIIIKPQLLGYVPHRKRNSINGNQASEDLRQTDTSFENEHIDNILWRYNFKNMINDKHTSKGNGGENLSVKCPLGPWSSSVNEYHKPTSLHLCSSPVPQNMKSCIICLHNLKSNGDPIENSSDYHASTFFHKNNLRYQNIAKEKPEQLNPHNSEYMKAKHLTETFMGADSSQNIKKANNYAVMGMQRVKQRNVQIQCSRSHEQSVHSSDPNSCQKAGKIDLRNRKDSLEYLDNNDTLNEDEQKKSALGAIESYKKDHHTVKYEGNFIFKEKKKEKISKELVEGETISQVKSGEVCYLRDSKSRQDSKNIELVDKDFVIDVTCHSFTASKRHDIADMVVDENTFMGKQNCINTDTINTRPLTHGEDFAKGQNWPQSDVETSNLSQEALLTSKDTAVQHVINQVIMEKVFVDESKIATESEIPDVIAGQSSDIEGNFASCWTNSSDGKQVFAESSKSISMSCASKDLMSKPDTTHGTDAGFWNRNELIVANSNLDSNIIEFRVLPTSTFSLGTSELGHSSEEEDFTEDEILKELRKRRANCLCLLAQFDSSV